MRKIRFVVLCLAAYGSLPAPGGAWEIRLDKLEARVKELHAAWDGKEPEAISEDMLDRAKQKEKPSWVRRVESSIKPSIGGVRNIRLMLRAGRAETAWREENSGRRARFGVGAASGRGGWAMALEMADRDAAQAFGRLTGIVTETVEENATSRRRSRKEISSGCLPSSTVSLRRPKVRVAPGYEKDYQVVTNLGGVCADVGTYTPVDWYLDEAQDALWVLTYSRAP